MDLDDSYGDGHALVDPADAGPDVLRDEDDIRDVLSRLLSEPGPQADMLRRMAYEDALFEVPLHPSADLSDAAIVECLTEACMQGRVALVRTRKQGGGASAPRLEDEEEVEDDADVPCDFEFVLVRCAHMPDQDDGKRTLSGVKYWMERGSKKSDLPTPRAERSGEKMIEVVAGIEEKEADKIAIELSGGPGYNCGKSHPHVKVTRGGETVLEKKGETSVEFNAVAPAWSENAQNGSLFAVMKRLWSGEGKQNVYKIDISSCGRNPSNEVAQHGRREVQVRVYDKALYKLVIEMPALGKRTDSAAGGGYLEQKEDIDAQRAQSGTTEKGEDGTATDGEARLSSAQIGGGGSPGSGLADTAVVKTASMVTFERDGVSLELTKQIDDLVDTLVEVQETITDIKKFIQDFQPKVGWTFDFEVELFKGNLTLEWGKREWTDHTIYDWWKFSVGMTLFHVSVEASFGIEFEVWWADVVAQVYGSASITAEVTGALESNPGENASWAKTATSTVAGALGVRAALGANWVKAEGEITVSIDFTGDCKVSSQDPFHVDWRIDRKKVEATLTGRIRWIGSFERDWELWPARDNWVKGRFPDA